MLVSSLLLLFRWGELITKSPEYGTMKETWHASLVEATRTADVSYDIEHTNYIPSSIYVAI